MVSENTSGSRRQKDERMICSSTLVSKKRNNGDESKWPHFTDDDYIVFCFGEGGKLDVKDNCEKSEPSNLVEFAIDNRPRPRNRKLNYDANPETISKPTHDEIVFNEIRDDLNPRNEEDFMKSDEKTIEEEIISTRSSSGRIDTRDQTDEYDESETTVSGDESSYSNESEISGGSFAFPILGWERTGSPVQMPKSEGMHIRKHKVRFLPFQCFRLFDKS